MDRPVAKPYRQQATLTTGQPCTQWDSNTQSQQLNGRRPTPYTAQTLRLAPFIGWEINALRYQNQ